MNLNSLTDDTLISKTDALVAREREILAEVLHHLREIERRRLFSELGYKSLFDLAVKRFGYSEDQAYRRIAAMRLLKELPEIEERITAGAITLSNIGIAHALFRNEQKIGKRELSREEKLTLLSKMEFLPARQAERVAISYSSTPQPTRADRVVELGVRDGKTRLLFEFESSNRLKEQVETLRGLLAHQAPQLSLAEVFEKACDLAIAELSPAKSATSRKQRVIGRRREVWMRAGGKCVICASDFALEMVTFARKPKAAAPKCRIFGSCAVAAINAQRSKSSDYQRWRNSCRRCLCSLGFFFSIQRVWPTVRPTHGKTSRRSPT